MINNKDLLREFERDFIRGDKQLSFRKAINLFEGMWKEGCSLGVLPPKHPMEGIETDLKISRVLNSCLKNSCPE